MKCRNRPCAFSRLHFIFMASRVTKLETGSRRLAVSASQTVVMTETAWTSLGFVPGRNFIDFMDGGIGEAANATPHGRGGVSGGAGLSV